MNDLKALTDSILTKAGLEAEAILKGAEAEKAALIAEATEKAAAIRRKISDEYRRKTEDLERRSQIELELSKKKKTLAVKHQIINKAFEAALSEMRNMPAEKRIRFLAERLAVAGMENGGEVIGAGSPAEWNSIIKVANEIIARAGKLTQLTLSGEQPDFDGGFALKGPGFRINGSYQSLLDEIKDTLVPRVAMVLFAEEKG